MDCLIPDGHPQDTEALTDTMEGRRVGMTYSTIRRHRNGTLIAFSVLVAPSPDPQGPPSGSTDQGNTLSNYDPEEIRRKHSVQTSVIPVEYGDTKINLLDLPGFRDFIGEIKRGLRAAAPDQLPPGTAPAPPAWALNRLHQTHVQLWMPERRPPRPGEQGQLPTGRCRRYEAPARGGCGCAAPWPETDPPRPSNHTNTQNLEIQQGPRP